MTEAAEALARSKYVGSSDIAGILGLSRYGKTAVGVYLSKVSPGWNDGDVDKDQERRMLRGKLMEPVVRQMAESEFKLTVRDTNRRYVDPVYDFMRAEIDFEFESGETNGVTNGEIKTASPLVLYKEGCDWGDADSMDIPIEYYCQVQYGMMVSRRPVTHVYCLFGSDDLVRYVVERDEEMIAGVREKVVSFWFDHVQKQVPPPVQTYEDAVVLIERRKSGYRLQADDEVTAIVKEIQQLRGHANDIERRKDELEAQFGQWVVDHCDGGIPDDQKIIFSDYAGREIASWNRQRGAHLDQKRLEDEMPEIKKKYMKEHFYRVLRLKKPK